MSQKSQKSQLGGSTCTPRSRCWFWTYNNYENSEISEIYTYLESIEAQYVFQEETGEQGTPHLQGVTKYKNQKKFNELKNKYPKIHWEICKDFKAACVYCSKNRIVTGKLIF